MLIQSIPCRWLILAPWLLLLAAVDGAAQEPGWASNIVVRPEVRAEVESTPILERPYRPLHFYGNTVRRRHYRGTALPAPRDLREGLSVATRRPYVPVENYLRRGL